MCTGRIAFVRGVMAASTASGSTLNVCSSMSANTGVACWNRITLADATNENDEVTTSSPGPTPSRARLACRPAVPLEQATAWAVPAISANASSKRRYIGPSARSPERSTSSTSSSSRPSRYGRANGIWRTATIRWLASRDAWMLGAGWDALDDGSVRRAGWACPGRGRSWRPAIPGPDPAPRSSWNQPSDPAVAGGERDQLAVGVARHRLREDRRPGNQDVGAGTVHVGDGGRPDAAVDLHLHGLGTPFGQLAHERKAIQRRGDERLPAESGVDAHAEQH